MEQQVESIDQLCAHHWLLENDKVTKLPKDAVIRHPNCIGRSALCKKCGTAQIFFERVWDQAWKD